MVKAKDVPKDSDIAIVLISWTGQHENAARIENAFYQKKINVKVIYSDSDESVLPNMNWIRVPNDHFFSQKFERAIRDFEKKVLLFITADVTSTDWLEVLRICKIRFRQRPDLAIWSPNVDYSPWLVDNVLIQKIDKNLNRVVQTDSIVWAIDRRVVKRMLELNYDYNKFGWGIDSVAALFSHSMGYLVAIDTSITVSHPRGSGYEHGEAHNQMKIFFSQLTSVERDIKAQFYKVYGD